MSLKQYIYCLLCFIVGCPIVQRCPDSPDDAGKFILPWALFLVLWILSCIGIFIGTLVSFFSEFTENDN